jgi:hypothetical protein
MNYLLKHKSIYLMIAGTLLPAVVLKKAADFANMDESTQNILFIAGAIAGAVLTNKMIKR